MIAEGPKSVLIFLLKCQKMKDVFIEKVNYYDLYNSEVTPINHDKAATSSNTKSMDQIQPNM